MSSQAEISDDRRKGETAKDYNIRLFSDWVDRMTDQDYVELIFGSSLSRTSVATAVGFGKSALNQNNVVKASLLALEVRLRTNGILPELTAKGEKEESEPKSLDRKAVKSRKEDSIITSLQERVVELEAENKALRGDLGRFSEVSEVLAGLEVL